MKGKKLQSKLNSNSLSLFYAKTVANINMNIRELKSAEEIKKFLEYSDIDYVKVAITDIDGILRGKYMHSEKFIKSSKMGFGFCDVIFGWDINDELYEFKNISRDKPFTGWHSGFPDVKTLIVPNSGRVNPFEKNIPLFLAELAEEEVCPRGVLKNILSKLEGEGIKSKSAFEYEFFLFNETPDSIRDKKFKNLANFTPGMFGYSILRNSVHSDFYNKILNMCSDMDMPLEGLHTETGPGVFEAALMVDESINSADKASIFKTFTKVLCQKNNLMANFMAKWSDKYPGQSGHIHVSLEDSAGNPIFASSGEKFPDAYKYFIGGLQKYMREFSIMIAPTVNSYKRLCPGAWAPINMTWGIENRTTAFRAIKGDSKSQRIENRLPGADSNPYLALAATLGAGFLGIEEKIIPTAETIGGAYDLKLEKKYQVPANLAEAAYLFKESEAASNLFGEKFVKHFANTRIWEYQEYKKKSNFLNSSKITPWELERYFEII